MQFDKSTWGYCLFVYNSNKICTINPALPPSSRHKLLDIIRYFMVVWPLICAGSTNNVSHVIMGDNSVLGQ